MPGPAAGFQLPGGRLIVGAYHGFCANFSSPGRCEKAGGAAFAFPIFSDDEGATWSWENGHAYDVGGTGAAADGEAQVAPAPNGSLIMRTRTARHQPPGMAWSNDNGTSWTNVLPWTNDTAHAAIYQNNTCACDAFAPATGACCKSRTADPPRLCPSRSDKECSRTKPVVCKNYSAYGPVGSFNTQGSVARLPGSDWLVTSSPFSAYGRMNMTVFKSKDSGASWRICAHIYDEFSGYSALAGLNATHAGLLWEISAVTPSGNPPGSGQPYYLAYTVVQIA